LPDPRSVNPSYAQHINALALLAEVWDYYGRFDVAKGLSIAAPHIIDLSEAPPKQIANDTLTQSKIRLMVAYMRSLYRAPERTDVVEKSLDCRRYVREHLASDSFLCYGTLGEIAYTLGRAYRQRRQFADALREL